MNTKTIIIIVVCAAIVICIAAFIIRKRKLTSEDISNNAGSILSELEEKNIKPSYPNLHYIQFADQIFAAVDGPGTNEDSIFQVFYQLKNRADWVKLISAYGVREDLTLTSALRDDLNVEMISKLNKELQRIKATPLI